MPTQQFHVETRDSAGIGGFNTNRKGGSVVHNGLSLEYPLYENSLSSVRISVSFSCKVAWVSWAPVPCPATATSANSTGLGKEP